MSQGDDHQILIKQFEEDVELPPHGREAQVGFTLEGGSDLRIEGEKPTFTKGDRYYIPAGVEHSSQIYAGYTDITFFDEPDHYHKK